MSLLQRCFRARQDEAASPMRWDSRPGLALILRALMAGVPAATAVLIAVLLERSGPPPTTWPARIVTWALLLGVSTIVARAVERRMRGLVPLALLLRMTLVFPDEAPSRYAVARAAHSPAKIKELAVAGRSRTSLAAAEVLALVARLGKHDRHTRGHSERVRVFTDLIAEQMGISGSDRDKLAWGALLHDIGKMEVPGELLNKAGMPTPAEWEVIKKHPAAGGILAGPLGEWLGPWAGGITQHHERFDGKGYPHGVAGVNISLAGRIVAVADSYETMTAARSYKKPMSVGAARKELTKCAGAHFDPEVVRAFLAVSLPRLMWGVGPLSFLAHLPFVVQAETVGVQLAAVSSAAAPAAAAAAVGAASVVTASAIAPSPTPQPPPTARVVVAESTAAHGNSANSTGSAGGGSARVSPTDLGTPKATSRPVPSSTATAPAAISKTSSPPTHSATSAGGGPAATGTPGVGKGNPGNPGNSGKGNGNGGSSTSNSGNGNGNSASPSSSNNGKGKGSGNSASPSSSNNGNGKGKGATATATPSPSASPTA
jgi:HD-GYP domain-containing protein (c-di-GMP phosphodiesterase class II)